MGKRRRGKEDEGRKGNDRGWCRTGEEIISLRMFVPWSRSALEILPPLRRRTCKIWLWPNRCRVPFRRVDQPRLRSAYKACTRKRRSRWPATRVLGHKINYHLFLDVSSHLCDGVCPSVRPSVRECVRRYCFRQEQKNQYFPANSIQGKLLKGQSWNVSLHFYKNIGSSVSQSVSPCRESR